VLAFEIAHLLLDLNLLTVDQTAKHRLEQEKVQAREELENIELEIGKFSAEEKEINQAHTEAKKNLVSATVSNFTSSTR
jgi:uncharacterized protein (DUF3084 family)